jgi:hypothetical protein
LLKRVFGRELKTAMEGFGLMVCPFGKEAEIKPYSTIKTRVINKKIQEGRLDETTLCSKCCCAAGT